MRTLFLDANIILDFYRFGSDDLDQIESLVALIEGEEIKLLSNVQLKDEVFRNREKVLAKTISDIGTKYSFKTPRICEGVPEAVELNELLKQANSKLATLQKHVETQAKNGELRSDKLIRRMLEEAENVSVTEETHASAARRVEIGNPPGKRGSLGDAIHWESLLASKFKYIHLVTRDGDFKSELDGTSISAFLKSEWSKVKGGYNSIKLHSNLSSFLKEFFPDIKLSEETAKNELIDGLAASSNFATTHALIGELNKFKFFTNSQVTRLFEILVENNQVGWIATDDDVKSFYEKRKGKAWWVPASLQEAAANTLEVEQDVFFSPF